ncbi:MAG: hypothetical protein HZT43_17245 [Exiguobacterium profundum]|nr:MAG: hypothetical protein HZT43_17245 [Exiguobacterium profundum]
MGLVLGLVVAAARRQGLPEPWKRARHAWAFTLFGIAVAAATVHLWNALFVLFLFLIGAGAWLVDAPLPAPARRKGIGAAPSAPSDHPPGRARRPAVLIVSRSHNNGIPRWT